MFQKKTSDVRRCSYNLFAAVSSIVKQDMAAVLNKILPLLLLSVNSKEGISLQVLKYLKYFRQ
jgi:hypothetical protein